MNVFIEHPNRASKWCNGDQLALNPTKDSDFSVVLLPIAKQPVCYPSHECTTPLHLYMNLQVNIEACDFVELTDQQDTLSHQDLDTCKNDLVCYPQDSRKVLFSTCFS